MSEPVHVAAPAADFLATIRPEGATAMAQPEPRQPTADWLMPESFCAPCDPSLGLNHSKPCRGVAQIPSPCQCAACRPTPASPLPPPKRRLRACVEAWPGAYTLGYDPRCCRFPGSCSADVYDEAHVTDADLEPRP